MAVSACQASGRGEPEPASAHASVSEVPAGGAVATPAQHVLLVVQHDASGFHVRHAQVVASALPSSRFPEPQRWRADVEDSTGKPLFSADIPAGGERRGEFVGADGGMQAVHFHSDDFAFVVRVPLLAKAAQLRFWERSVAAPSAPSTLSAIAATDVDLGVAPYPADVK